MSENEAAKQKVADAIAKERESAGFRFLSQLPGHEEIAKALREANDSSPESGDFDKVEIKK